MLDTSASLDLRQVSRLIGDAVPADRWTPPPGLLSWPCGQERRSGVCTWRSAWWSSLRRGERGAGRRIARYQKGGLGPRVSPPDVRGRGRGSSSFGTPKADPSTQAWTPRFAHRSLPGRVYPRPLGKRILEPSLSARRLGGISHAMQAEGDVVRLPAAQEGPPDFAAFFADERAGLLKLLYFVTGNRADAADLMQDAFLKLWQGGTGTAGWPILGRTCSAWRSTGPGCGRAPHAGPRGGWWGSPRRSTRSTR